MSPKTKSAAVSALILFLLAVAAFFLNRPESIDRTLRPALSIPAEVTDDRTKDDHLDESPGFASHSKFVQHYKKHGHEFGNISQEEYLRQARVLRDAPAGEDILEFTRVDGVVTRFARSNGAFIAFNRDKTIRTYFRPNDGEAYFHRQAKRR